MVRSANDWASLQQCEGPAGCGVPDREGGVGWEPSELGDATGGGNSSAEFTRRMPCGCWLRCGCFAGLTASGRRHVSLRHGWDGER